jgi:vacuolar-type H+-ATPase subunit C/Vma6
MHNKKKKKREKRKCCPISLSNPSWKENNKIFFKNYFMFKFKSVLQLFTYLAYLSNFILLMGKSTLRCNTFQHVVEFILEFKMVKKTLNKHIWNKTIILNTSHMARFDKFFF